MIEAIYKTENEVIFLTACGPDDYNIYYRNGDCSVRGTLLEIMQELNETFGIENLEQVPFDEYLNN